MNSDYIVFTLPWWSDASEESKEHYRQCLKGVIKLYAIKIATESASVDLESTKNFHKLLTEFMLPLAEQDGQINFGRQHTALCVKCGLEIPQLAADIRTWFTAMTKPIDLGTTAFFLDTNSAGVRQLILDGDLPATKVDQEWSIMAIDALNLAIKRQEQKKP